MPMLTIAGLILREAARRRLLLAIVVLTLLTVAVTGFGFSRIPLTQCGPARSPRPCSATEIREVASILLILVVFMFSFVLALAAAFMAAPAIAGDVDSGIALAMLPRPIRRSDVVLGKWLGLAVVLAGYAAASGFLELAVVKLTVDYVPPRPFVAVLYLIAEGEILLTLSLLGSTRLAPMTGGIIALVLFGLSWLGGIAQALGFALRNGVLTNVGTISSLVLPTDGLWRGALYNIEPPLFLAASSASSVAAANPFSAAGPPSTPYLIWAACWVVAVLGLSVWSFSRREL